MSDLTKKAEMAAEASESSSVEAGRSYRACR